MSRKFSRQKTIDNTSAPGTVIYALVDRELILVYDVAVWNKDSGSSATITFYDEDSNVYLVVRVASDEMAVISLNSPLVYGAKDIYARTDSASDAEVTVTGTW